MSAKGWEWHQHTGEPESRILGLGHATGYDSEYKPLLVDPKGKTISWGRQRRAAGYVPEAEFRR